MDFNAYVCFAVRQLYNFYVKILTSHETGNLEINLMDHRFLVIIKL